MQKFECDLPPALKTTTAAEHRSICHTSPKISPIQSRVNSYISNSAENSLNMSDSQYLEEISFDNESFV